MRFMRFRLSPASAGCVSGSLRWRMNTAREARRVGRRKERRAAAERELAG